MAKYYVGLDIGTSSIKFVKISVVGAEVSLHSAKLIELGIELTADVWRKKVVDSLKVFAPDFSSKGAEVIFVISDSSNFTTRLLVPSMPKGELREAIRWEVKKRAPISVENMALGFEISDEVIDKGVKKYEIILGASLNDTLNRYVALLNECGINPASVCISPFALTYLLRRRATSESAMILNMGARLTDIVVLKAGRFLSHRIISFASHDLTKSLTAPLVTETGNLRLSIEEAERIKKTYGIPEESATALIEDKLNPFDLISLMRPALERLASEVQRTVDYHKKEFPQDRIDHLLLAGGEARLKNLCEYLEKSLALSAKVIDPFENVKVELGSMDDSVRRENSSAFAVAMGAALSEAKGINLLPRKVELATKIMEMPWLKTAAATMVGVLLIGYAAALGQLFYFKRAAAQKHKEFSALFGELKAFGGLEEAEKETRLRRHLVEELTSREPLWGEVLKELSNITPANIAFSNIKMERHILTIRGQITAGEQAEEATLSGFMFALERGIFRNVTLVGSKKNDNQPGITDFELRVEAK